MPILDGIDTNKLKRGLEGINLAASGITGDQVLDFAAQKVIPSIKSEIARSLGREPSQAELAVIVNRVDLGSAFTSYYRREAERYIDTNFDWRSKKQKDDYRQSYLNQHISDIGNKLSKQFVSDPDFLGKTLPGVVPIGGIVDQIRPNIDELQKVRDSLGEDAPFEVVNSILTAQPQQAQQLAASYVKAKREGTVKQYLEDLPGKQKTAIDDLDTSLRESQGKFFAESLQPSIERNLNARGLLRSGSLSEAFAGASSKLNTAREATIAPLRAETSLGALKSNYENLLRGALESGQSLSNATAFANNLFTQNNQNQFTAGESALSRQFQEEQNRQNQALVLAQLSQKNSRPSGVDQFLQYGLPVLGQLGGGWLSSLGNKGK